MKIIACLNDKSLTSSDIAGCTLLKDGPIKTHSRTDDSVYGTRYGKVASSTCNQGTRQIASLDNNLGTWRILQDNPRK